MRMHYLRIWQLLDIFFVSLLLILAFIQTNDWKGFALCYLLSIFLLLFGIVSRKLIVSRMKLDAKTMGLKQLGLLKHKENRQSIYYEVHILLPDKPISSSKEVTRLKIMREFINDIKTLYNWSKEALQQKEKSIVFFGTSHSAFIQACIRTVNKLGVGSIEVGKNMDPLACPSQSDWREIEKKLYGTSNQLRSPSKEEWQTIYVTMTKKDVKWNEE